MTRGRRKDTTLPLSRGLAIQRAYRDRKARYIADLEDRCRKAEEENRRLKEELAQARTSTSFNPDLAQVCSDLMHNLQKAQTALSLFQRRAVLPVPDPDKSNPSATELDIAAILTHALRQDPPRAQDSDATKCCGGLIVNDCEDLVD